MDTLMEQLTIVGPTLLSTIAIIFSIWSTFGEKRASRYKNEKEEARFKYREHEYNNCLDEVIFVKQHLGHTSALLSGAMKGVDLLIGQLINNDLEPIWIPNGLRDKASSARLELSLRDSIMSSFALDELRSILPNIGINPDDIPGDSRPSYVTELVMHMKRRDKLDDLIELCKENRPGHNWPSTRRYYG